VQPVQPSVIWPDALVGDTCTKKIPSECHILETSVKDVTPLGSWLLKRAQEVKNVLLLQFRQTVEETNRPTGLVGTGRRWTWTVVCDCSG